MRFAVIANVQGNLVALQAVLGAIQQYPGVTRVVSAGDLVGLGPHPDEVIDLVREWEVESVKGNYDDAVAFQRISSGVDFPDTASEQVDRAAVAWTRRALTPENLQYLKDLPRDVRIFESGPGIKFTRNSEDERVKEYRRDFFPRLLFGGLARPEGRGRAPRRRIMVVHGSPRAINELIRPETANSILAAISRSAQADLLISGHAGIGFIREAEGMTFIGVGSVSGSNVAPGQADFAVVDVGKEVEADFQTVAYDPSEHVKAIVARGLPPALAARFDLSNL